MPALGDISVLKNDGTTSVVYSAKQPASADAPAIFQAPALGATNETKPEFRAWATRRPDGSYRITQTYQYPYHVLDSTTGVTSVQKRVRGKRTFDVEAGTPQSVIDEATSQFSNISAHSGIKAVDKEGFGPT